MNSMRTTHRMHKRVSDEQVDVIWNWRQMIYRIVECARLQGLPEFMLCLILRRKNVYDVFWRGKRHHGVAFFLFLQPPLQYLISIFSHHSCIASTSHCKEGWKQMKRRPNRRQKIKMMTRKRVAADCGWATGYHKRSTHCIMLNFK